MKKQFAMQLATGSPAKVTYQAWKDIARKVRREAVEEFAQKAEKAAEKKIERKIGKKVGKRLIKKVPIVGLIFIVQDVEAKGVVGGIGNSLLDQVPWVGWAKLGFECIWGDWIPDRSVVEDDQ